MKQKIVITGPVVHDVGYRVFLLKEALDIGFELFNVANKMENGGQAVVAMLEGDDDQINQFIAYATRNNPPMAQVTSVKSEEYTGRVMSIDRYLHLIQVEQLDKGIRTMQSVDGKMDRSLENQGETIEEIRRLRADTIRGDDGRLARIEKDIRAIKNKLVIG